MKKMYKIIACILLVINVSLPIHTVYASEALATANTGEYIKKIVDYKVTQQNVENVQQLLDTTFSKNPISGVTETYCLGLRGFYQDLNYSIYQKSLTDALKTEDQWKSIKAPTFQKHALVYEAIADENPLLSYAKENTMGKDGIMSYIYGLFLLEASEDSKEASLPKDLVYGLLTNQLKDGGFAYYGDVGDVDVTAFVLQALAPYKDTDTKTKEAVDKALQFLSEKQLIDGDFASFGTSSSDSTAQVMLALCALGIDCNSDARFIKNGHNMLDGLIRYQLPDGSFAHTFEGQSNDMSTAQSLSALVALYRYENGQDFLYLYSSEGYDSATKKNDSGSAISYQWVLTGVILVAALLYTVIFARKNRKKLLGTCVVATLLLLATWFINIQSAKNYYGKQDFGQITEPVTVTTSIRCDTVAGKDDFIPKDGVILAKEMVTVQKGATILDVLLKVTAEHNIQMEYKDAGYIEGIGYLYQQAYGNLSGWMYQVNGKFLSEGAGEHVVDGGEDIVWVYTCNMGKDVGGLYSE